MKKSPPLILQGLISHRRGPGARGTHGRLNSATAVVSGTLGRSEQVGFVMEKEGEEGSGLPEASPGLGTSGVWLLAQDT